MAMKEGMGLHIRGHFLVGHIFFTLSPFMRPFYLEKEKERERRGSYGPHTNKAKNFTPHHVHDDFEILSSSSINHIFQNITTTNQPTTLPNLHKSLNFYNIFKNLLKTQSLFVRAGEWRPNLPHMLFAYPLTPGRLTGKTSRNSKKKVVRRRRLRRL
jgi:hypothetical protein